MFASTKFELSVSFNFCVLLLQEINILTKSEVHVAAHLLLQPCAGSRSFGFLLE